jgi:hypothetical protein
MPAGKVFAELGPYARVLTALAPFLAAIVVRLLFGKNRLTETLLSVATMWFLVNILVAPYALEMQQELHLLLHR